ncbi:unnamed protein product, partial [Mesorhabditis belari]|uniref:Uncharacterized protein n=1 Tax=Mesorhabditis belari TaxID=2138241 RepID=A0AAF3FTD7_9BILA
MIFNKSLSSCEEEQERRLRELATMYRGHFEEITEMTTRLRNENGELKKRLTEHQAKTTAQSTSTQLNSIKMQFEDREKEYGLTLTKIRNEMEFLQKELERRENQVNRLTHRLDELTIDNKKMNFDTISDDELAKLKSEISRYRNELDELRDQNENLKFSFKENTQREIREKHRQVEKDCDEERQQRMDLTEILLEMSKDLQEIIQWSKILEA